MVDQKNKRLHPDEQSFIIYFINTLNVLLAKNLPSQYESSRHPFIDAFKENCKAVIGIDEATDFSLIDLLCMSSLNHPKFSSVTLSGDLMQKVTGNGINSWADYQKLNKGTEIRDLEVSYRQSQTLLNLAQAIFYKVNKKMLCIDHFWKSLKRNLFLYFLFQIRKVTKSDGWQIEF